MLPQLKGPRIMVDSWEPGKWGGAIPNDVAQLLNFKRLSFPTPKSDTHDAGIVRQGHSHLSQDCKDCKDCKVVRYIIFLIVLLLSPQFSPLLQASSLSPLSHKMDSSQFGVS